MSGPLNEQAFPIVIDDVGTGTRHVYPGMTLRDWFAGHALQVTTRIAGRPPVNGRPGTIYDSVAEDAYALADAMLAARGK